MRSFFEWFHLDAQHLERPWLILGKGPSFSKLNQFDTSGFFKISLNHVVREEKVKLAHIVDFDVAESLGTVLNENAEFVVMPWHPHIKCKASRSTLEELLPRNPTLSKLNHEGRLLWYNAQTSPLHNPSSSVIVGLSYFSVEGALNLLALSGVKKIRTLGIDGGNSYSGRFNDLVKKTLLSNGRKSFDIQFGQIRESVKRFGLDFGPLDLPRPIKVYVGSLEEQMVPTKVLEYSIQRYSSMPVEVIPLHKSGISIPVPTNEENKPRTPFSFQRFLIPQLEKFSGRAIYLDSDMQVFEDVRFLWQTPFDGADILTVKNRHNTNRRPQFSVMLLNCQALNWKIEEIVMALDNNQISYEQLVLEMGLAKNIKASVDASWNSLEYFKAGETKLLHYTDMNTQPWISVKNPMGKIWCRELLSALKADFISMDLLVEHRDRNWIRPSLVYQMEKEIEDPSKLDARARALDANFKAPYLAYSKSSQRKPFSLWKTMRRLRNKVSYGN